MMPAAHHLPPLSADEVSSIVGWISIWVWVCVYSPQLHENYILKSGEGLSIIFIIIWLAGDALNMLGAWIEGLLPTMIILAGYYCLCDVALIWQYFYYRKYHDYFHPEVTAQHAPTESTPLLRSDGDAGNVTSNVAGQPQGNDAPEKGQAPTFRQEMIKCVAGIAFTTVAGVLSWYVTTLAKWGKSNNVDLTEPEPHQWRWDAQAAGWASALLYLASRVPQIFKNRQTKCEGLSLALFVFAVVGNLTYVASILIKSTERNYVVENLSWLVGSLGTIFLDFVVLGQFIVYREEREELVRRRESSRSGIAAGDVHA